MPYTCVKARRAFQRRYYAENRESCLAAARKRLPRYKEARRKYWLKNKKRLQIKHNEWRRNNLTRQHKYEQEWRKRNKGRVRQYRKRWRASAKFKAWINSPTEKAKCHARNARYYAQNKTVLREKNKAWIANNKEHWIETNRKYYRRVKNTQKHKARRKAYQKQWGWLLDKRKYTKKRLLESNGIRAYERTK